jgi:hypothetical protein
VIELNVCSADEVTVSYDWHPCLSLVRVSGRMKVAQQFTAGISGNQTLSP